MRILDNLYALSALAVSIGALPVLGPRDDGASASDKVLQPALAGRQVRPVPIIAPAPGVDPTAIIPGATALLNPGAAAAAKPSAAPNPFLPGAGANPPAAGASPPAAAKPSAPAAPMASGGPIYVPVNSPGKAATPGAAGALPPADGDDADDGDDVEDGPPDGDFQAETFHKYHKKKKGYKPKYKPGYGKGEKY